MKLGILQCDSTLDIFRPVHGNYPEMFMSLFQTVDAEMEFQVYDVQVNQYPDSLEECDGYLITGSKYSVYDDEDWIRKLQEYVVVLHENQRPLVGICFGHQMIARALGGKTEQADQGWGVGAQNYETVKSKNWTAPNLSRFSLLASHKDQVTQLPDGAELIAESAFCPHASYVIGNHILTFQGHPEFQKEFSRDLMIHREKILGEEVYENGMKSLDQAIHSLEIAKWMYGFLFQPKND